ncbi:hypothetical protein ABZY09_39280 [Streptomyces sp. NPDC002928]|uniref:hypothetical protein n=1 Tax=Streptomyces sp. NPDC002928 TaxID=3154440 RepID=UPI0033BC4480
MHTVRERHAREDLLISLAAALAAAGHRDRALALAHTITEADALAEAPSSIADTLEPSEAKPLIAEAFRLGKWTTPLKSLARTAPSAVVAITGAVSPVVVAEDQS